MTFYTRSGLRIVHLLGGAEGTPFVAMSLPASKWANIADEHSLVPHSAPISDVEKRFSKQLERESVKPEQLKNEAEESAGQFEYESEESPPKRAELATMPDNFWSLPHSPRSEISLSPTAAVSAPQSTEADMHDNIRVERT